jgi:hypothetical protein
MVAADAGVSTVLTRAARAHELGACGAGRADVSPAAHPSLYGDWAGCQAAVTSVPDARYCERTIFHSFWGNVPVREQAVWFIASFLATQDAAFTELWVWSPPGVPVADDPLLAPFLAHVPNRVHFKAWDAAREGAGTAQHQHNSSHRHHRPRKLSRHRRRPSPKLLLRPLCRRPTSRRKRRPLRR